jgi:vacuolar-type H+-ATPase subunit E/Vma4
MTLERLIEEIRTQAERELDQERQRTDAEERSIAEDRDRRTLQIGEESHRLTETEAARERAQRVAAAKMQARKLVYETREKKTGEALVEVRKMLSEYTRGSDYPAALKRMFAVATDRLGKTVKITGRPEDAAVLKTVCGKSFDDGTPAQILGGIIAEAADGSRRLNLSFDELLRLREDEVRSLLA